MKRPLLVAALAGCALGLFPSPASADGTLFYGYAPNPAGRPARGFALGATLAIVGFEFEYSTIDQVLSRAAPGLKTYMFNGMLVSPTSSVQVYLTAGGGIYNQSLDETSNTGFGTNFGGGIKFNVAGPLRIRLDYRVFVQSGDALDKSTSRFYGGANIAF
jgi:hypothetical protein